MTVNQWKLEESLDNANPTNLFLTIKELKEAIMSGCKYYPRERQVIVRAIETSG